MKQTDHWPIDCTTIREAAVRELEMSTGVEAREPLVRSLLIAVATGGLLSALASGGITYCTMQDVSKIQNEIKQNLNNSN